MKGKSNVSYFPVDASQQALLLRVQEADVADRVGEVVEMIDRIAESHLTLADLDQAIQLFTAARQTETLDARFDNLEARLKERIDKKLAEMEGRLSQRLTVGPAPLAIPSPGQTGKAPAPAPPAP